MGFPLFLWYLINYKRQQNVSVPCLSWYCFINQNDIVSASLTIEAWNKDNLYWVDINKLLPSARTRATFHNLWSTSSFWQKQSVIAHICVIGFNVVEWTTQNQYPLICCYVYIYAPSLINRKVILCIFDL